MKNYDEITESVLEKRDEYLKARTERRKTAVKGIVAGVSCLCVCAVVGVGVFSMMKRNEGNIPTPPEDVTPSKTEEQEKRNIIYSKEKKKADGDVIEDERMIGDLYCSSAFAELVEKASDDDLIAFGVNFIDGNYIDTKELTSSWEKYSESDQRLSDIRLKVADELMKADPDMSQGEAEVRAWRDPRVESAYREVCLSYSEYVLLRVKTNAESNKELVRIIEENFEVIGSYKDDSFPYLFHYGINMIALGTKKQIKAFGGTEEAGKFRFTDVSEDHKEHKAEDYLYFPMKALVLEEESKLSVGLSEAYAKRSGEKIRVTVAVAHFENEFDGLEKWELEGKILEMMGMTREEFDYTNDPAVVDRFLELLRSVQYHTDENIYVIENLFEDGEIVDATHYNGHIIAELTEQRARELSGCREIAFICIAGEEYGPGQDIQIADMAEETMVAEND